ncbi:uncharacterized protein PAC_13014 [Phialocephala subalpina]|uniref:Fungal N-terminal domain-containing protein n=1 Tax=Phialocephala subalpina TaxID=576137 RepID=A0A1L7XDS4_9HELO|nr:uncharacterized protein PAC_13014 [Phialocephala subalpina]
MPIPFGVGVGDFIAVGKLIKQIVVELQENGEAAPQYQGLLLELEALSRALALLETLQPAKHELIQLSAIRAAAITCKRPLEEFLSKIWKFESRLGIFNARDNRYKGFARRMHFSMMYKDEIKELRSILGIHVATINLLLITQTVRSITMVENEREQIVCGLESKILAHQRLLEDVKRHVEISLGNQLETKIHLQDQSTVLESLGGKADNANEHLENQEAVLQAIQTTVTNTQVQTTSILTTATDIMAILTSGVVHERYARIHVQAYAAILRNLQKPSTNRSRSSNETQSANCTIHGRVRRHDGFTLPTVPTMVNLQDDDRCDLQQQTREIPGRNRPVLDHECAGWQAVTRDFLAACHQAR